MLAEYVAYDTKKLVQHSLSVFQSGYTQLCLIGNISRSNCDDLIIVIIQISYTVRILIG